MSRLIDADAFYKRYCEVYEYGVDEGEIDRIAYMLSTEPTAYDVEKVVAELDEMRMNYFLTIANTGSEKLDIAYGYTSDAVNKAIEIVRKGGVE